MKIVNLLRKQPELLEDIELSPLAESAEAFSQHLCKRPIRLDLQDGSVFEWHIADFGLAMRFFAHRSENFRELLRRVYARDPCSPDRPWEFVLYNDEAVPGAVLRMDNRRKLVCYYATIKNGAPRS